MSVEDVARLIEETYGADTYWRVTRDGATLTFTESSEGGDWWQKHLASQRPSSIICDR